MKAKTITTLMAMAVFATLVFAAIAKEKHKPKDTGTLLAECSDVGTVIIVADQGLYGAAFKDIIPNFMVVGTNMDEVVFGFHSRVFGPLGGQR